MFSVLENNEISIPVSIIFHKTSKKRNKILFV